MQLGRHCHSLQLDMFNNLHFKFNACIYFYSPSTNREDDGTGRSIPPLLHFQKCINLHSQSAIPVKSPLILNATITGDLAALPEVAECAHLESPGKNAGSPKC